MARTTPFARRLAAATALGLAVRLVYTYPAKDPLLPANYTIYSRHVKVSVQ